MLYTLAGYYSGQYVSNFNRFNKLYRVMIQSSPEYRIDPESLDKIFTRTGSGEAVPGYSSGDAIRAIREVAASNLPRGYSFEFAGISREESQTTSNTAIIFLICTVFVYLILCGLYESFLVPFAVILAVPFGLMGSFVFAKLMGMENNIYMQTGLIMLIGLLPLMFASGAGANGNSSLGSGVVGGMLFGILAILFFVPVFFILFQYLQEKVKPVEFLPNPDWEIQSEMEEIQQKKLKK